MKKIVCLLSIVIFLQSNLNPQSGWVAQNSGINQNLFAVHFFNQKIGWAVGDEGTIIKTSNSGNDWAIQFSGTSTNLTALIFVDTLTGWVVGRVGTHHENR